ncbi:MAG: RNase H family protein [Gemmatimonadaceae bacterium]|jgi:uracil-DNA glycosylase
MTPEELLRGVDPAWHEYIDRPRLVGALDAIGDGPVTPPPALVFEALRGFGPDETRVVIIGQDPYPTPGDAQGLCFSVPRGRPLPESLVRIFGCLDRMGPPGRLSGRLPGQAPRRTGGDLRSWAAQGVLMLNTALTTAPGVRGAHAPAWKPLVGEFLRRFCAERQRAGRRLQFLLWGGDARAYAPVARAHGHVAREWTHPSPLIDNRLAEALKFRNCPHFEEVNAVLREEGRRPIDWEPSSSVFAYTDGACSNNGGADARAGFAAVFAGGAFGGVVVRGGVRPFAYRFVDEERLESGLAVDDASAVQPSNNRGELLGLAYALLALLRGRALGRVEIVSDSKISIMTLREWLPERLAKGTERELKNFDLVWIAWRLLGALRDQASSVTLTHVRGHQRAPGPDATARERLFHRGNELADEHAASMSGADDRVEVLNPIAALVGLQ